MDFFFPTSLNPCFHYSHMPPSFRCSPKPTFPLCRTSAYIIEESRESLHNRELDVVDSQSGLQVLTRDELDGLGGDVELWKTAIKQTLHHHPFAVYFLRCISPHRKSLHTIEMDLIPFNRQFP